MTDAWALASEVARKASGGKFVRLTNDRDKVVGVFCGEPHIRQVFWNGSGSETYDELNPAHKGKALKPKFVINFYDTEAKVMKIYEMNTTGFATLERVKEKYGLERTVFEIMRLGQKGSPKTTYSISPEGAITEEIKAALRETSLHDLTKTGRSDDASE